MGQHGKVYHKKTASTDAAGSRPIFHGLKGKEA